MAGPSAMLDFPLSDCWPIYLRTLWIFHHYTKFVAKILIDAQIMAHRRNSKRRPPPFWIYFRWQFLTYCRLYTIAVKHRTKFHANISLHDWIIITFWFKMATVRHLGFVTSSYRTTHEVFSFGHISMSNFMLIRCIVLKIWRFEFLPIWLEMPIHALKILFFGGSEPLNVIGHHRDPQKAPSWPEPHLYANFGTDRSIGATCARDEGIKKERKKGKERNLEWQTGCSPRPPKLTQRYKVLHAGWSSGGLWSSVSSFVKIGWTVFEMWGSKFAFSRLYLRPVAYAVITLS